MNCRNIERELLLDEAGELAPARREALERHLSTCAACQALQSEQVRWSRFFRSATTGPTPSDALVARVLAAASAHPVPARPHILYPMWRSALAVAASLAILAGFVGLFTVRPAATAPGVAGASRLTEVSSLLGMLMEEDDGNAVKDSDTAMVECDLQSFARQLLILEGLDADVAEEPAEDVIRIEGRQPTTLQWRSTIERPPERCV